jgi:hypothetical protein
MLPRLYMPERSKQQIRFLPASSMSQPVRMRRSRVCACLAVAIHWMKSRRAAGVIDFHCTVAAGDAASACLRSGGTFGSGSLSTGTSSSTAFLPASTFAASCSARGTFSQCLPSPSGSRVALNGCPCSVPVMLTIPRECNCLLAAAGNRRNRHVAFFGCAGRCNGAAKRIGLGSAMNARYRAKPTRCMPFRIADREPRSLSAAWPT